MPWSVIINLITKLPPIIKDAGVIISNVLSLIQLVAMLLRNNKQVKEAIPSQPPTLISMVQHSANKAVLLQKEILPGPVLPPNPDLERIIKDAADIPKPSYVKLQGQKHVSLVDGTVTYE